MNNTKNYTCPKCNAPLIYPKGKDSTYCEYCGSQIFIKDSKKEEWKRIQKEREERNARIYQSKWYWAFMIVFIIVFGAVLIFMH